MACMTQMRVGMWIIPGLKNGGGGIVVCIYTRRDGGRESSNQRDCKVMRDVEKRTKSKTMEVVAYR